MADYSVSPLDLLDANRQKGYVGIHVEQGVPVLDRDLNLLHDLVAATVRDVVTSYIGNGSPAGDNAFAVKAVAPDATGQNFALDPGASGAGRYLVGGIEVSIGSLVTYRSQVGVPDLTTPTSAQPDPRIDTVYLDVFLIEVDQTTDTSLDNSDDVGVQTSVRLKPAWIVRVAEGIPVPPPPSGHSFSTLAQIARKRGVATIDDGTITDQRQLGLTVSDVERRLRKVETALLPSFAAPEFVPRSNVPGGSVVITGTNFNIGTSIVRFGDVRATAISVDSPTQITATVPPGVATEGSPVSVLISVENAAGKTSVSSPFAVLPVPDFAAPGSQFSPASGVAGTSVTLHGDNFNRAGFSVQFGTITATVVGAPTAHQAVVQVPPGLVTSGTSANVKITVNGDFGSSVSDDTFQAQQLVPPPTFTSPNFSPKTGVGGTTITLNGTNFNPGGPVGVKFDTVAATVLTTTATQITANVPTGMTTAGNTKTIKISVTTAGGTVTSTDNFGVTG